MTLLSSQMHKCRRMSALLVLALAASAFARLDTERYSQLREAERYQMDIAEKLSKEGKWESALAEYEKFIKLYPNSVGASYAQYMIAVCNENRQHINEAIKEYKALLDYFPRSTEAPLAAMAIARCNAKTGEAELAVQQFMRVVTQFPQHTVAGDALWEASEMHLSRGLIEKAVELRRRLVENYPKSERFRPAVDWLVEHYLFRADDLNAARNFCRLHRSPEETEFYLGARLYDRGHYLCRREGKLEEGRKWMDKAIQVYENIIKEPATQQPKLKEALGMIAQSYRHSARHPQALKAFEELLEKFPADDHWREQFARCLEEADRWSDARLQFMRFKDKARGDFQVAESYHRQRKVQEAEEAYMRVVEQHPNLAKYSLYRLGELHHHVSRNFEKAINAYRQSEYNPPQHLFRIGECFERWKNYDMAIKTYQEIIGFFEEHAPEAMWRIGHCYENRNQEGDLQRAIATFKRLCDRYPKSHQSSLAHQRLESKYNIHYTGGGMK